MIANDYLPGKKKGNDPANLTFMVADTTALTYAKALLDVVIMADTFPIMDQHYFSGIRLFLIKMPGAVF